jgi:class 3 adenylate cyclase/tetratricopeptide (TPR) repeat protein
MKCGAQSPSTSNFCGKCGAPFDAAPSRANVEPGDRSLTGERRHLTVLFCDLVNSTGIATQLDPEEWREIIADYHRTTAQAIEQFGGHVAQSFGDGVMAYFGWPQAHDNNAERAVRAGLAIIDALSNLNKHTTRPKLSVRVGINSGAVVIGAGIGKKTEVFGDTPNIAARAQAAALADTVVITADTHRLISGLFVVEDRGMQVLKGIERPIKLHRVIRLSDMRGHLQAAAAAGALTPFVGRDDELRLLMTCWERVLAGEGRGVLISGEAGYGKSRLVQRFHQQIGGRLYQWVEAAAAPFFQNTPLYSVAEILRQLLVDHGNEPDRVSDIALLRRNRGRTQHTSNGGSNGHSASEAFIKKEEQQPRQLEPALALTPQLALAQIVNRLIPTEPASLFAPDQQLRQLLSRLAEWVFAAAGRLPLVIAIEDLQWADASTLELLQLLVEQGAAVPLLILCTARPEFRIKWSLQTHHTQITLSPLSAYHARMMVEHLTAQKTLPEETVATVVDRTGGVPLFVEELTRAVLESDNLELAEHEIPATLHDFLMARLDRLGPAKEVIQIGAVIGSEFSYELIREIHAVVEKDLQSALHSLVNAQLLYVLGTSSEAAYRFKHALIRDAAYEALLKSRRKELHSLVARVIDEKFPAIRAANPEVLARHWAGAGETEKAIVEWSRAGKTAQARNACREAVESYRQALELLNLLPASPERDGRELELRQAIVSMLIVTSGFSASETIDAADHAAVLAEKCGSVAQLADLTVSRAYIALALGDLPAAGTLANRALDLAARDALRLGSVYGLQIQTRYWCGDLLGVEKYFTEAQEFLSGSAVSQLRGGAAPAFGPASWNAWMLGRPDVARGRIAEMMAKVNESNPYDVAYAAVAAAHLRVYLGEYQHAERLAADALNLAEKYKFSLLAALAQCLLGHARAQSDNATEGIRLIRQALNNWLELGSHLGVSHYTAYLAAAQERKGEIADALETIEQALRANPDELVCRPETLRIRGELRLKRGQAEVAESDFREALGLAHSIGAKAWELRIAMSLARLLAHQRRRDEAQVQLTEIYGRFTEGFDTTDLVNAKTLLGQLGRKP